MEEEGTAVYFETSPAAARLRENEEGLELIFTNSASSCDTQRGLSEGAAGNIWGEALAIFGRLYLRLLGTLSVVQDAQCKVADAAVTALKDSPLLTEEDFHLLHTALPPSSLSCSKDKGVSTWQPGYTWVIFSVVIVMAALAMQTGGILLAVMVTLILLILVFPVITRILKVWSGRSLECGLSSLTAFSSKMEALLSLLTHSLRTIQEVEVLRHGYSRPTRGVPINRLEKQSGCHGYQCHVLRMRVLMVCREGILDLRHSTQELCKTYPLNEELDTTRAYLAFTPLEELHRWLSGTADEGIDGDTQAEPTSEKPPSLSLESLKDACNLLAVQNSEFLRRLGLNLAMGTGSQGKWDGLRRFSPTHLSRLLRELLQFASGACEKLEWSLEFHRNCLFGEPPSRPKTPPSRTHPLQPVADDIHCLDLKTQASLQRIRELGSHLAGHSMMEDHTDTLRPLDELEGIREQLLAIQVDLESSRDLAVDSLHSLDRLLHKPADSSHGAGLLHSPHGSEDGSDDEGTTQQQQLEIGSEEEGSSCDEAVFEAYIPLQGDLESEAKDSSASWLTKEEQTKLEEEQREAREAPVKMMKELQSVLAVRGVEKERRKNERRQKRTRCQQTNTTATLVHPTTQTLEDASGTTTSREDMLADVRAPQYAEERVERTGLSGSSIDTSENEIVMEGHENVLAHRTATVQSESGLDIQVTEEKPSVEDLVGASLFGGVGERESGEPVGDRSHDWLAVAPQLGTLAQAVMAARLVGVASGKKTSEEVFGDVSDGDQ